MSQDMPATVSHLTVSCRLTRKQQTTRTLTRAPACNCTGSSITAGCHTTSPAAGQTQAIVSAHAAAPLPTKAPNRHTITAINTMQTQPCLHQLPPAADSFASVVSGACAAPVGVAHHRAGWRPASPLVDCLVVRLDRVNDLAVLPALRGKVNAQSIPGTYSKHQAAATSIQKAATAFVMCFTFYLLQYS